MLLKLVVFVTLVAAILAEESEVETFGPGNEICDDGSCGSPCSDGCYETNGCNGCSSPKIGSSSSPINITTAVDLANSGNSLNRINVPIIVGASNVNIMNHSSPNDVDINLQKETCCTVLPPQQCHYNNQTLNCTQEPSRICSPQCNQPLIIQRPIPYPVPIRVPYPVHVHLPLQSPCSSAVFDNSYYPSCNRLLDSTHLWQDGSRFLIHPYMHQQPPSCSSCLACGSASLQECVDSGICPARCQPYLQNVWSQIQSGQFIQQQPPSRHGK